ncbi:MAG: hypothetical protein LBL58_17960 [Tannerellaceae bacterium]|jgi:hypothetical protein|nr:hypothetical protein [Tannerellaceae bacterium]
MFTKQGIISQNEYRQISQYNINFSYSEQRKGGTMLQQEKLDKVCKDFSSLNEEKQDYILGILQALVFANNENKEPPEISNPGTEQGAD